MDQLQRYPLSVILSFLTETEGTSLLITKKRYARQLLPIFRRRNELEGLTIRNAPKHRHIFAVVPVQDPTVLLERLNTQRLYRRRSRPRIGYTTQELALLEATEQPFYFCPTLELLRFLEKQHDKELLQTCTGTAIASYPRSGNTLVRSLLERTTGVVTGSDTRPDRSLSRELAEQHALVGEGVTQQVMCIKSHWPERSGHSVWNCHRAIVVVRNPYDAIDSYWNMNATKSHTKTLTDTMYKQYADKFDRLVRNEIDMWLRFHQYWLECDIPILVVRFEDLVRDTATELTRILQFVLHMPTTLTPFWQQRVHHVTSSPVEQLGSYRPRSHTPRVGICKSIRRFNGEQLQFIRETCASFPVNYLQLLGYDSLEQAEQDVLPPLPTHLASVHATGNKTMSLRINAGTLIRPITCPYGRLLQAWRHSLTDSDANPLPTVNK
jgi:hypothetical protein